MPKVVLLSINGGAASSKIASALSTKNGFGGSRGTKASEDKKYLFRPKNKKIGAAINREAL